MSDARRNFTKPDEFPENLARNIDLAETMGYIAYKLASQGAHMEPKSFHDFQKMAVDLDTEWRGERNLVIARCSAEERAARERNQKLGPKIIYELLVENSQLVGLNGPPITEPKKLICSTCHAKYDWTRESENRWRDMSGENISAPTEKDLREFVEKTLYQENVTCSALFCHNLVSVSDYKRGRSILGSERKQECGTRLLTDYRVLPRK